MLDVAEAPADLLPTPWQQRVHAALVRVGTEHGGFGRGLMVRAGGEAFVLTASHLLPYVPDDLAPLPQILGRLGGPASAGATVLFADQVADIAILACPRSGPSAVKKYDDIGSGLEITLGGDSHRGPLTMPGRLETDRWLRYEGAMAVRQLQLTSPSHVVRTAGFSGSPVFDPNSRLVGVYKSHGSDRAYAAPVPAALPVWFLQALGG